MFEQKDEYLKSIVSITDNLINRCPLSEKSSRLQGIIWVGAGGKRAKGAGRVHAHKYL